MLIKGKNLARLPGAPKVVPLEVSETTKKAQLEIHKAKQEAKAIRLEAEKVLEESKKRLSDAQAKASEVIKSAQAQAEEIKKRTYNEILQVAGQEAEGIKSEAREILIELFEVKRKALTEAHKDIIKVALDLAEKIIKYQASIDSNVLKTQVIEAIKKATTESDRVQVYVNPQELKSLEKIIPELVKLFPSGIEIVPLTNDSVDQGSCIVETKSGQLDASFSTQLATLASLVTKLDVKEPEVFVGAPQQGAVSYEETDEISIQEAESPQDVNEPLINLQEEESFPFGDVAKKPLEEKIFNKEPVQKDNEVLEIPEEIAKKVIEQIAPVKKKLVLDDIVQRTKEEAEELDEEHEYPPKTILRPKKPQATSQFSGIAQELEKSPEWKDLLQDEDDE